MRGGDGRDVVGVVSGGDGRRVGVGGARRSRVGARVRMMRQWRSGQGLDVMMITLVWRAVGSDGWGRRRHPLRHTTVVLAVLVVLRLILWESGSGSRCGGRGRGCRRYR